MKTDIEIAHESTLQPITKIAAKLGLSADDLELYGSYKAKLAIKPFDKARAGKLILVTAINPTPAGEGKTTLSIGLADALNQLGHRAVLALREPSLGPVMGMKGGATGGGYSQVVPMEDINLHFTGDIHAIEAANNLISAVLDNHIYQGNELDIDLERIVWRRAFDVNDRVLREITVGRGAKVNGVERKDGFDIAVASEIMAVLCLSNSLHDLKERLGRMVVAYSQSGKAVRVSDLGCTGAAAVLLKDAIRPNLVQSLEGTAAFIHGGPFANIAHGCNSILATQAALTYGDFAITEAGFGADLGAEKFLDIVTSRLQKVPDTVVVVATVRALKYHGGVPVEALNEENLEALQVGYANLKRHVENMQQYGLPVLVGINRFGSDSDAEIACLTHLIEAAGVTCAVSTAFSDGGAGAKDLAQKVLTASSLPSSFSPVVNPSDTIEDKIWTLTTKIYGGEKVRLTEEAEADLKQIKEQGWDTLPVCIAKTPSSFTDNPKVLGAPTGFEVTVRHLIPRMGAGFVVALCGRILTMPGLPKSPAALRIDIDDDGVISGLM